MDAQQKEILEMALVGYRLRKQQMALAIIEIEAQLSKGAAPDRNSVSVWRVVRPPLSAAARERIAAAQRERWRKVRADRRLPVKTVRTRKVTKVKR